MARNGWRRWRGLLCAAVAPAQQAGGYQAKAICEQVPAIARTLTEITGFKLKHPVPCDYITKEQVNRFLKKRMKEEASPEEIRAEELTLKKFGLVPQDFDLAKSTVDLLTEQAAAFYDFDRKKLFITETTPGDSQEPVLAHELSHALADQNFNLAKYTRQGRNSDDGSTARLAVMEGQATWLMTEYLARQNGQTLKGHPELAASMAAAQRQRREPVSGIRQRTALPAANADVSIHQGNAVSERAAGARRTAGFRRAIPAAADFDAADLCIPEKYLAGEKPAVPGTARGAFAARL